MGRTPGKALEEYRAKRDFQRTQEPPGKALRRAKRGIFVVQKHAARHLHYDFRLELDGVLKSWAVPKGPSIDPGEKRLAVQVEDHPIEYADFEGRIPAGEYGGGTVMVWDRGTWLPEDDAQQAYAKGRLRFQLAGEKLRGRWSLVRMHGRGEGQWLLIKGDDEFAGDDDILSRAPDSAVSSRSLEEIGAATAGSDVGGAKRSVKKRATRQGARTVAREGSSRTESIPGARPGKPPADFRPQLATLYKTVPTGDDWLHEIKYDGYRVLAVHRRGRLQLLSRNGLDWTDRLPGLASACRGITATDYVLDGELVALDRSGISDFQELQNRLRSGDSGLLYYVFDLPFYAGHDLRRTPLHQRKAILAELLGSSETGGSIRYSDHIRGQGKPFYMQACEGGLEGIISKRADSDYLSKRADTWRKIKCGQRQEFVIAGFTDPGGARSAFGALLLGYYEGRKLQYAGRVGTGFTDRSLKTLGPRLKKLETVKPPFADPPADADVHWCRPELVCEVAFTGWTRDGRLRHPSFQGLREDKPAAAVIREQAAAKSEIDATPRAVSGTRRKTVKEAAEECSVGGVRLSNPDRVLYPDQGVTKAELAEYYFQVADWILPYVGGRPLSLVRCPRGRQRQCFFQKHLTEALPDAVKGVTIAEKDGESTYIVIDDLQGLITLVQFGTLEMHPWPARTDRLDRPDYLVFDLDPGPGVAWQSVAEAASTLRDMMAELGLESFLRTSGGKGLHVVVPIARRHSWDEMRRFAEAVARHLAEREPTRYVATASKAKRGGKIFIDYLRNARGATSIASYSTRARSGAPVAVPLRWDELAGIGAADAYNIRNLPRRLASLKGDPWEGFAGVRQRLPKL